MDFTFTPEQDEAAALAARILADRATPERMRAVEAAGDRFDAELWQELGSAGLLSLAVPEEYGGAGLGLIELARVLVEVGRTVAPVPLAVHGPTAYFLAELGSEDQKHQWLAGDQVLTSALSEERDALPAHPTTTATPTPEGGWVLDGAKTQVRAGTRAAAYLLTASAPSGVGVFLVTPDLPGVTVEQQRTSDGDVAAGLVLEGVRLPADALLGQADGVAAERLGQLVTAAACAEQVGVVEGAVALTADYARTREQFGRPIGTFQAVSQRLADGYIDTLCERLTLWQAVWRLSEGMPSTVEVATAKLWAADAGHRVAHTTVHVHGGVGIDLDGVAHRYFSSAKRFEFLYGGATAQALAVGRVLAAEPA